MNAGWLAGWLAGCLVWLGRCADSCGWGPLQGEHPMQWLRFDVLLELQELVANGLGLLQVFEVKAWRGKGGRQRARRRAGGWAASQAASSPLMTFRSQAGLSTRNATVHPAPAHLQQLLPRGLIRRRPHPPLQLLQPLPQLGHEARSEATALVDLRLQGLEEALLGCRQAGQAGG